MLPSIKAVGAKRFTARVYQLAILMQLHPNACHAVDRGPCPHPVCQLGIMHRDHGIGRDLAGGGTEKQIAAGRIAHRIARVEFGLDLAAGGLDLEARRVDLGSSPARPAARRRRGGSGISSELHDQAVTQGKRR
jgi:hypothetical protein